MSTRGIVSVITVVVLITIYSMIPFLIPGFTHFEYLYPFKAGMNVNQSQNLGDEYWMLAQSLANGNGFSDPFGFPTGPSAWMPPLYSAIMALLLLVLGTSLRVMWALTIFKGIALIFSMIVVHRICKQSRRSLPAWISVAFYFIWICTFFLWFFESLHDVWLLILLCTFMLHGLSLTGPATRKRVIWWGILGALIFLANPILFFAWTVVTIKMFGWRVDSRQIAIVFAFPVVVGAAWIIRNYVELGRFIPVKSNAYYELYSSSLGTSDGIYVNKSFENHPYTLQVTGKLDPAIAPTSELAIIDDARQIFLRYLAAHPFDFLRRVGNRLLAATVKYKPFVVSIEGEFPIFRSIVFALPFLGLVILVLGNKKLEPIQILMILIYLSFVFPYVLVAFYVRYLLGITPVLVLLSYWGADVVVSRTKSRHIK